MPAAIACVLESTRLAYRVVSVTVTAVGELLLAPLTVMVSPATEATVPRMPAPAGAPLGCGHVPPTAGLTCTDLAVTAPPFGGFSRLGRTLTQLPGVTSGRPAEVISLILVDGVKSTVAVPFCWVTWIASPAIDVIRPATFCRSPLAGGCVGAGAELVGLAD